jgi:hypothetical protein
LVRVKGELDRLSERFTAARGSYDPSGKPGSGDAERMRTEYQAQLALLQAELSQTDGLSKSARRLLLELSRSIATKWRFCASS